MTGGTPAEFVNESVKPIHVNMNVTKRRNDTLLVRCHLVALMVTLKGSKLLRRHRIILEHWSDPTLRQLLARCVKLHNDL